MTVITQVAAKVDCWDLPIPQTLESSTNTVNSITEAAKPALQNTTDDASDSVRRVIQNVSKKDKVSNKNKKIGLWTHKTFSLKTAFNYVHSLNDLDHLIGSSDQVKTGISFWGQRYVKIQGFKGTIHSDYIVAFVIRYIHKNRASKNRDLEVGKRVTTYINQIYTSNKKDFENKNWFSKLLCRIIDCWNNNFKWMEEFYAGLPFQWGYESNGDYCDFYKKLDEQYI